MDYKLIRRVFSWHIYFDAYVDGVSVFGIGMDVNRIRVQRIECLNFSDHRIFYASSE